MKYLLKYDPEILDVGITLKLSKNYVETDTITEIIDFIFTNKNKIKSYTIYEVKLFETSESKNGYLINNCVPGSFNIQA